MAPLSCVVRATCVTTALLLVPPAGASDGGDENPLLHLEKPHDPYLPPDDAGLARHAGARVAYNGFTSVQVNVDPLGQNIPNDAGNEPSIAVDPTAPNRIVIGWRQFDNVASNFRQAGWAYSHDGGRTWTHSGVINPGVFRSDPVLSADTDGTIYYCSLMGDFSVQFFKSFDGGVTWGPALSAFGGDKQWFTIDRTGGPGHGNIYEAWSTAGGCCGNNIFTRSTDAAASFMTPIALPDPVLWGTMDVAPDGTYFQAGIIGFDFGEFRVVRSANAQFPAQTPSFAIASVNLGGSVGFSVGPNPAGLLGQVNVAVNPVNGDIYVVGSVDPPGTDPLEIRFSRSSDGGVTWSAPVTVNDDFPNTEWQWFGTMSVAPNGRIDVIWNDTRSSGQDNLSQTFYATSSNGGVSWSTNVAMTPVWDSHVGWPNQNKIGDYYDMISDDVGAFLAYSTTFNGEQDVYFLRLGDWDCNTNGVGDAQDIEDETSADCNGNGIPDECEIAAGTVPDENGDGIPDGCPSCPWDLDGSGDVGINDLLDLLAAWGAPYGINDLLDLLAAWGPCP